MKYEIHIKCINEPVITEELFEGRVKIFNEATVYHAACGALEQLADEILLMENHPVEVALEASGRADSGERVFYQARVRYEPFSWSKKYGDEPSIFDEEGIEPYSYEVIPVKPTKAEADFLQILSGVFPVFEFKYEPEAVYCRLENEWVNIYETIARNMSEKDRADPWIVDGLGSSDDRQNKIYMEYQIMRDLVESVRDKFFKPHHIDLEIKCFPTFAEFSDL